MNLRHAAILSLILTLLPACAPSSRVVIDAQDGLPLVVERSGSSLTSGPTLVFVHGWCCDRTFWDAQVEAFRDSHRTLAIDLAGHGESGRDRQVWTLDALAADVATVLRHHRLQDAVLVGHSMGGPVSLKAAALEPDRVRAVIAVDTLHNADFVPTESMMGPMMRRMKDNFDEAMDAFVRSSFRTWADPKPDLIDYVVNRAQHNEPDIAISLMGDFIGFHPGQTMAACPVPIRCINAAQPWPTFVDTNRTYARDYDVTIMDGVGHFPMIEEPERFNQHLRDVLRTLPPKS